MFDISKYPIRFDGNRFIGNDESGVVYLWTDRGEPCYVGVTKNRISERINDHLSTKNQTFLFQKKLRSRPNSFRCYIVDSNPSYIKLLRMEEHYIRFFNTFVDDNPKFGYNLTRGGEGLSNSTHRYWETKRAEMGPNFQEKMKQRMAKVAAARWNK